MANRNDPAEAEGSLGMDVMLQAIMFPLVVIVNKM